MKINSTNSPPMHIASAVLLKSTTVENGGKINNVSYQIYTTTTYNDVNFYAFSSSFARFGFLAPKKFKLWMRLEATRALREAAEPASICRRSGETLWWK